MRFVQGLVLGVLLWLPGQLALRWWDGRCHWEYGEDLSPSGQPFNAFAAQKLIGEGSEIVARIDEQRWLVRRRAC